MTIPHGVTTFATYTVTFAIDPATRERLEAFDKALDDFLASQRAFGIEIELVDADEIAVEHD